MERSRRGAATPAGWERWDTRNVAVGVDGVTVSTETLPTYGQGRPATVDGAAVVDVALAPCGDPYLLTTGGDLYRYDPDHDTAEALSCTWRAMGDAVALCVTADTIYVAGTAPTAVQAISRYALGTRWVREAGADAPVALVRRAGEAYLLDGASHRGAASVLRVRRDGRLAPVVEGLIAPRDVASDADGRLWVLDDLVGTSPDGRHDQVVRRFDADALRPGDPVTATDSVHLAPEAFRLHETALSVRPTCLAVGAGGGLLVGVGPDGPGQATLLRYRPDDAAFERQRGFEAPARTLAAAPADPRAYAVDSDGGLRVVDGDYRTRRTDDGAPTGRLVARFEASEEGVQWHRVSLDRTLSGTEDEVRVRYATTDAHEPVPRDEEWEAPPLESLAGLGPTYAGRLRRWGIEDLADLADRSPAAVRSMVSVEELDVSEATVREWQTTAQDLLDAGEASDTDVTVVDGVGPTYAARLSAGGVPDLAALAAADAAAIARVVSAGTLDVPLERTSAWVQTARDQRPQRTTYDDLEWTTVTPSSPTDALLADAVGRYCYIELELLGTATTTPTVSACHVEFPRDTYLSELPAIYREDARASAFLERYLSLFERVFTDVEADTEALTGYLDPDGIPDGPDHLAWLGSFLGMDVDETWPTPAARTFVDRAPELYRLRGTRRGLRTALDVYLDHVDLPTRDWAPARAREDARLQQLVEDGLLTPAEAEDARTAHERLATAEPAATVRLRAWSGLSCADDGPATAVHERLLGCPEGVLVLLHPRVGDEHVQRLARVAEAQEPAHASVRTVGLDRRVQLAGTCEDGTAERGYHTYLGVNTTLAERSFALDEAGLGEETVLDSHEPDGQLNLQARLGADAHLS